MKEVPNDIIETLIRCLPVIIDNVEDNSGSTRLKNAVRLTRKIINRLNKINNNKTLDNGKHGIENQREERN